MLIKYALSRHEPPYGPPTEKGRVLPDAMMFLCYYGMVGLRNH